MKRNIFTLFLAVTFLAGCGSLSGLGGPSGTVTEAEAATGIRQALNNGVSKGISILNKEDGFFGNQAYRLFLPPDARKIENVMRDLGMSKTVDRAILQINRAAEDAVGYATPIFTEAIREMTIQDAWNIIRGEEDAATRYFREKTTAKLTAAFSPIIQRSLDKLEATRHYADIINAYNRLPTTFNKLNPDLPGYVTERAVNALFDQIAKEEANIRANPRARTTEILKKVFGSR
ncbi:MAG TPA: DUF4197 domain-containing protein [Chitinophagaceae bacterium]|nr:DUF4197 domain-containing protein [Chitinophagaceae bacterium]